MLFRLADAYPSRLGVWVVLLRLFRLWHRLYMGPLRSGLSGTVVGRHGFEIGELLHQAGERPATS